MELKIEGIFGNTIQMDTIDQGADTYTRTERKIDPALKAATKPDGTPNDNDRIVSHACFVECLDHATDLGVHVAHAGQIRMLQCARQILVEGAVLGDSRAGT